MFYEYQYEIYAALGVLFIILCIILLQPKYKKFKSLVMYNAVWKWKWKDKNVYGLACYCPNCKKQELYFDDEIAKTSRQLNGKITFLICKNCQEIGKVQGGDRSYVLSLVKREILKRVNNKEFS